MGEGHRERVRNRFMTDDMDHMPEVYVLEAYLHGIIPRRDTRAIAERLLETFGDFGQVAEASIDALMQVEGIGLTAAKQITMLPKFLQCYMHSKMKHVQVICDPQGAAEYLAPYFLAKTTEMAYVLCLNKVGKILACERINNGTETFVQIPVKAVLGCAFRHRANGVILAHNHPGSIAVPSGEDLQATKRMKEALDASEVSLIDHLIFDSVDHVSLRSSSGVNLWANRDYCLRIGVTRYE